MEIVPFNQAQPSLLHTFGQLPAGVVTRKTDFFYDSSFVQPTPAQQDVEVPSASESELAALRAEFTPKLVPCEDCGMKNTEIIVTPDPLYGKTPNDDAGHIGFYSARCMHTDCLSCGIAVPGDRWFHNTLDGQRWATDQIPAPVTLEEHRAAIENTVAVWNGQ